MTVPKYHTGGAHGHQIYRAEDGSFIGGCVSDTEAQGIVNDANAYHDLAAEIAHLEAVVDRHGGRLYTEASAIEAAIRIMDHPAVPATPDDPLPENVPPPNPIWGCGCPVPSGETGIHLSDCPDRCPDCGNRPTGEDLHATDPPCRRNDTCGQIGPPWLFPLHADSDYIPHGANWTTARWARHMASADHHAANEPRGHA